MKIIRLIPLLLLFLTSISCNSKLESDNFSEKDVIGSYNFEGYASHLKRELEIVFDEDHTGYGTEYSYSTTSGNLLSAHKYVFTWRKNQNKVLLTGVSASANSDGDTGSSTSWEAEFEFKYDMFMPTKGFIDGYAESMIRGKMKRDVAERVRCVANYYTDSYSFGVVFSSDLPYVWPDYLIKCGFTNNYPTYYWLEMGKDEDIAFGFEDAEVKYYFRSIKKLNKRIENGEILSQSEKSLLASCKKALNDEVAKISRGETAYSFAVSIGDRVFDVVPTLTVVENQKNPYWDEETE